MRWKLRTIFILLTVFCILAARYGYMKSKFRNLRRADAMIILDWQNPVINRIEFTAHMTVGETPQPITFVQRSYSLTPKVRTITDKLIDILVVNEPVAIAVKAEALDDGMIDELRSMKHLQSVILTDATMVVEPHDPNVVKISNRLDRELSGVEIYVENQR